MSMVRRATRARSAVYFVVAFAVGASATLMAYGCSNAAQSTDPTSSTEEAVGGTLHNIAILGSLTYGEITPPVYYSDPPINRAWSFQGSAGDAIQIDVEAQAPTGYPRVWLLTSSFTTIETGKYTLGETTLTRLAYALPSTGTFYVAFRDVNYASGWFGVALHGPALDAGASDGSSEAAASDAGDASAVDAVADVGAMDAAADIGAADSGRIGCLVEGQTYSVPVTSFGAAIAITPAEGNATCSGAPNVCTPIQGTTTDVISFQLTGVADNYVLSYSSTSGEVSGTMSQFGDFWSQLLVYDSGITAKGQGMGWTPSVLVGAPLDENVLPASSFEIDVGCDSTGTSATISGFAIGEQQVDPNGTDLYITEECGSCKTFDVSPSCAPAGAMLMACGTEGSCDFAYSWAGCISGNADLP